MNFLKKRTPNNNENIEFKGKIQKDIEIRKAINGNEFFIVYLKKKNKTIKCFFGENNFTPLEIKKVKTLVKGQEIKVYGKFGKKEELNVKKFSVFIFAKENSSYNQVKSGKDFDFAIIDLETTGLSNQDEIIEIAYIKGKDKKVIKKFESLVCPSRKRINSKVNVFNNISYESLKNSPSIKKVFPTICDDLKNSIIVGNNVNRFDYYHLNSAGKKHFQEPLSNLTFDTYHLFKSFFPQCCKEKIHDGCFGLEKIIHRITKNFFIRKNTVLYRMPKIIKKYLK